MTAPTMNAPRSAVHRCAAIAAPHPLATEAGLRAFSDGGTAIDAAIAAAAVLTVVYPHNVALGGDLVALVRTPDGRAHCVNASGWAGRRTDVTTLRTVHGAALPTRGADTVTVPGGVRGWETLRQFGSRRSWSATLAAAEAAAADGVPVAPSVAWHLAHPENADLRGLEDFDRAFRPGGHDAAAGDVLHQPELARTFARLRDGGPDEFYAGDLARRSVAYLGAQGSSLEASDFADFRPEVGAPLTASFGGLDVLTSPPNTHGFVLLRVLHAIDRLRLTDPLGRDFGTVMRLFHHANAVRDRALADPRYADVDVAALVHGGSTEFTAVGDAAAPVLVPRGDTVGVSALDGDGTAVSLIQSVYYAFGSGLVDPETGVLFHNRGTSFSLDGASPNVIAPRKRPAHTLMPAMTVADGAVRHVLSTMGGQGQPQILAQILLHAMAGTPAADAVAAPRAIVGPQYDGITADVVSVESDAPQAVRAALAASGLVVAELPAHTESLGQANVVFAAPDGTVSAASDPRCDGTAAVLQQPRGHA